jgi:hypothetical protein
MMGLNLTLRSRGLVRLVRYNAGQAVYCWVHEAEVEARLAQGWELVEES